MRRLSLSTILIGVNVGLVLLAVVCVALAAVSRLERLADEQALARVGLAGANALKAIDQAGDEALTATRLLAERPTLADLLVERDVRALTDLLERFRETGRLSGAAVSIGGEVLASSGPPLPWRLLASRGAGSAGRFLERRPQGGALLLAVSSPVPGRAGTSVLGALLLDAAIERSVTDQVGLPVRIFARDAPPDSADDPRAGVRSRALDAEMPVAERLEVAGVYVAAVPLRAPAGAIVGLVETEFPRTGIGASLRGLERSLLLIAAAVGGVAILLSFLVARRLARPLEALTAASARIGGGDFGTPIPRAAGLEIGALAATMEEMRARLLQLTAELRRRQAEAEAVLTGIAEGVFAVDRERRVRYLNPQAAALLGLDPAAALGRFCGDVLNPQGPGGTRPCEEHCPIIHARFSGSARATEHLLSARGDRRTVVITSAAAEPGGPSAADGSPGDGRQFQVMRDETEVEATRRLRDAVLANISHEFRTPLTAQLASIELLRDRLQAIEAPEARQLILSLERGTLRLTQLIDNLLESVRIESGERSIRRRPLALDEVLEEATELMAPLIAQSGQRLSVALPYPLPPLRGDAPRLTQVFVNLLANANKFAPQGSAINIGGAVSGSEVTVWVEDEGPGLSSASGAALFERFVRSAAPGDEDDEEPEQSGMGLGLWIVKSIVERHGGRVEALRAEAAGPGTRMCVILPLERGDEGPGG